MPEIDVRDEGADSSGTNDSTDAFKAALLQAAGNGVRAPVGTYRLSGSIVDAVATETLRDADPTGARDSTEAFRVALSVAAGRGVMVPAGTYRLSGQLVGAKGLSA